MQNKRRALQMLLIVYNNSTIFAVSTNNSSALLMPQNQGITCTSHPSSDDKGAGWLQRVKDRDSCCALFTRWTILSGRKGGKKNVLRLLINYKVKFAPCPPL